MYSYHVVHLISNVLQPALDALSASDHRRQLAANNGLAVEGLTEGFTLACPLQAFLDDQTLTSCRAAAHDPSLVVEVRQDDEDSSTFRPKGVLNRNFHIVKLMEDQFLSAD